MSSHEESCGSSLCPTEDIDGSETATVFEAAEEEVAPNAQVIGDTVTELEKGINNRDLESLLRDVWEDETPGTSCGGSQGQERCEDWIRQSSQPTTSRGDGLNESEKFKETSNVDQYSMDDEQMFHAMKIAALLKDSLKNEKDYAKFGFQSDDERSVPLSKLSQLYHDVRVNLPEALMTIIHRFYEVEDERFMKQILMLASKSDAQLDETDVIENKRFKRSGQEMTLNDSNSYRWPLFCESANIAEHGYFNKFIIPVLERSKIHPCILTAVEEHVNSIIDMSKGKNTPWISISNDVIYRLIIKENTKLGIGLSPEGIAKHVKYVYEHIWENIIHRCLTLLTNIGFLIGTGIHYRTDFDVFYSSVNLHPAQEEAVVLVDPEPEPLLSQSVNDNGVGRLSVAEYAESLHQEFGGPGAGGGSIGSNVSEGEESVGNRSFSDNELGSSQSESEVELARSNSQDSQANFSYNSQGSLNAEVPVPSRSPVDQNRATPDRLAQFNDQMNESYLGFLSGSSQGSDASGPILKYRRLH